jgi:hypothetical protein
MIGYFLDYYSAPHIRLYIGPQGLYINMANNIAVIPGSGNVSVVFTYSINVACFVITSLNLLKWEKESYIIGDKVTWN